MIVQQVKYQDRHRRYSRLNQNGYTFVEGMIVLFIVTIILGISVVPSIAIIEQKKLEYFFEQFKKDVYFAQSYAMSHDQIIVIVTDQDNHRYSIKVSGVGEVLLLRDYDTKINIQHISLQNPIIFFPNGNIKRAGKLHILYGEQTFAVVFFLGKGRFYVKEV